MSSELRKGIRLLVVALGIGLLAGCLLAVLTSLVARSGPQGDGWSFRGNGALIVPFCLGPAVLAGAWAALALHYERSPQGSLGSLVVHVLAGMLFPIATVIGIVATAQVFSAT